MQTRILAFPTATYKLTDDGTILRLNKRKLWVSHAVFMNTNGYLMTRLCTDAKQYIAIYIHRLLALNFIDNPINHRCVCHNDGNKLNNNLDNLRWDTYSANAIDSVKHGTCFTRKLNDSDVLEIRRIYKTGLITQSLLAEEFKTTPRTVARIARKRKIAPRRRGWKMPRLSATPQ